MLDQLNGTFDPGPEVYDTDPELNVTTYVLRLVERREVQQAMDIIAKSGLMTAETVYAIARLYSKTRSSLINWEDLKIRGRSLIEVSIESEEGDEGLHYAIYIFKTF